MSAPQIASRTHVAPVVLLVDGDADTRAMYAEYLRLSAWTVDQAENGAEALAKAIAVRPDIIITETRLPAIDGYDLCTLLRRDPSTRATPIVVVTGDGLEADLRRAKNAGANVVLVKPCLPERLLSEVARLRDEASALRDRAAGASEESSVQVARAEHAIEIANAAQRRTMLSRVHARHDTIDPPAVPPSLFCPTCDQPLRYLRSHVGGVSARHPEQWDYFECAAGCGAYQYRQRTRKLRRI
jgi:CheY-like chemotaxis protein